jgi:hypothetical protein
MPIQFPFTVSSKLTSFELTTELAIAGARFIVAAAVSFTPLAFATAKTVVLLAIAVKPRPRICAEVLPLPVTELVVISIWLVLSPVLNTP